MKNPVFSKTIQGILLAVLPHFLAKLGLKFDEAATQGLVEELIMVLGGLWGIYGRFKAEVPIKNPLASNKLPLLLALGLGSGVWGLGSGCASLSPAQNAALKAIARTAVIFGLQQLGDSVKELRPYQPALLGVINATFTATDNAAALGDALAEGVKTVVQDEALRAQVLAALKAQLSGAPASGPARQSAIGNRQSEFNAAMAARL